MSINTQRKQTDKHNQRKPNKQNQNKQQTEQTKQTQKTKKTNTKNKNKQTDKQQTNKQTSLLVVYWMGPLPLLQIYKHTNKQTNNTCASTHKNKQTKQPNKTKQTQPKQITNGTKLNKQDQTVKAKQTKPN